MGRSTLLIFATACLFASTTVTSSVDRFRVLGPQGVNLWMLESHLNARQKSILSKDTEDLETQKAFSAHNVSTQPTATEFPARRFLQPLDHFDKKSKTFRQRYWVNTRHYNRRKGAPVIVLDCGETSGENCRSFLDTGIVEILARETGGVGVILEHRYYGESLPVTDFSTDSLRFLNNKQSAADSANFMKNIKFDGIKEDLRAPGTPWIYYGGSYAGARAAHMKVLYPEIVWGAIASSAVTHATLENWQYMDVIRNVADPKCVRHLVKSIRLVDRILTSAPSFVKSQLKRLFGLNGLDHDEDFVSVLEIPLDSWQNKNWDPAVGSTEFDEFCEVLDKGLFGKVPAAALQLLPFNLPDRMTEPGGGWLPDISLVNYAKWIKKRVVDAQCPSEQFTVEECFGTFNNPKYQETGIQLTQKWRPWYFQLCTEWGYFSTAPSNQSMPRIVSKFLTFEYKSKLCNQAFPPGKYFSLPPLPNITAVNTLGDFWIEADRLAFIDGEVDPWRPNTPHSDDAPVREDTVLRPFKLIPNGVHFYDQFGLANLLDEPPEIQKIHKEIISFVKSWLKDWNVEHGIEV